MRKSARIYTEIEIEWLKENYPIYGSNYCSEFLNISLEQVRNKINKLKLNKNEKIDIKKFKNIDTNEVSYILGLLWADGHIHKDNRHINISLVNDDMIELKDIFMTTGKWNYYIIDMKKYGNYKIQGKLSISNVKLYKILYDYGFSKKSELSPNYLLKDISEKLQHYFFRGLIDGDGCFYINTKHHTYQLTIASTINQDWTYIENLCNKLKIKYRIDIINNIKSKSSIFRVCKKKDIIILGDYIYQDFSFGLNRKYQKFLEIKNS